MIRNTYNKIKYNENKGNIINNRPHVNIYYNAR